MPQNRTTFVPLSYQFCTTRHNNELAGDHFPGETGTVFGAIMTAALLGGTSGPSLGGWLAASNPMLVLIVPLVAAAGIAACTLAVTRLAS